MLLTFSTSFAAAVGNRPRVIVGASSPARKGTSAKPVRRFLLAAETQAFRQARLPQPDNPAILSPCSYTSGPLSTGEGLIHALHDPSEETGADGTALDAGVDDKRPLIVEGEFGLALRAMQRDGNTLSNILRNAWDVANSWDTLRPLTINSRIKASNLHVCLVGHITGAELFTLLSTSDTHNGLANRMLWACARRAKSVPVPAQLRDTDVEALAGGLTARILAAWQRHQVSIPRQSRGL